jgi:serine/threonine protein kinase
MVDRVGQRLGNYRLLRLIGQGGFADVYLGEHVHLRTQAAIKVLQVRLGENNVSGFLNEARTIAHLVHPYIIRVLDFGVQDDTPFLVMDYAPKGTFRQRFLHGRPLPAPPLYPFIKHAATALQHAHDKKLVHRDVKPENMLIGPNDEVLLSDFGFALIQSSVSRPFGAETAGTAAYMAPEQLQGKPCSASDQYSLGIVAYEWLTGDCPFHGTFFEIASQHMLAAPRTLSSIVPSISPELEQVVMIALAKNPNDRFPTVRDFASALERACLSSKTLLPGQVSPTGPSLPANSRPGVKNTDSATRNMRRSPAGGNAAMPPRPDGADAPFSQRNQPPAARSPQTGSGSRKPTDHAMPSMPGFFSNKNSVPFPTLDNPEVQQAMLNGQQADLSERSPRRLPSPPLPGRPAPGGGGLAGVPPPMQLSPAQRQAFLRAQARPQQPGLNGPGGGTSLPGIPNYPGPKNMPPFGAGAPPVGVQGLNAQSMFPEFPPLDGDPTAIGMSPSLSEAFLPLSDPFAISGAFPESAPFTTSGKFPRVEPFPISENFPASGTFSEPMGSRGQGGGTRNSAEGSGGQKGSPSPGISQMLERSRNKISSGMQIFLILMIGFIVIGSIGIIALANSQMQGKQGSLTSEQQGQTATSQAQRSATAGAIATATAQVSANPYAADHGSLTYYDTMRANNPAFQWQEDPAINGGRCVFSNESYHAQASADISWPCYATGQDLYNFTYQVDMKFIQTGATYSSGGLIFRANKDSGEFYLFLLYSSGRYLFEKCVGVTNCTTLINGTQGSDGNTLPALSSFKAGKTNTVAAVVIGDTITLFVNHQRVFEPWEDTSGMAFKHGYMGVFVHGGTDQVVTDVAFTNEKLWK